MFALLMQVIKISQRNLIEIAKEMEQKKSQVKLNMTYYYTGNKGDKRKVEDLPWSQKSSLSTNFSYQEF